MATAQFNPSVERFRGKFGNRLYRRYGRKVNVIPLPDYSKRHRNARQKECSINFAKAHAATQKALADPILRALYARRKTRKYRTLRGFIMASYLHLGEPPRPIRKRRKAPPPPPGWHFVLQPDFDI